MDLLKFKLPYDEKPKKLAFIMSNKGVLFGVIASVLAFALGVPWVKNDPKSSVFVMLAEASPLAMAFVGATFGVFAIYAGIKMLQAFGLKDPKSRNRDIVHEHLKTIESNYGQILTQLKNEKDQELDNYALQFMIKEYPNYSQFRNLSEIFERIKGSIENKSPQDLSEIDGAHGLNSQNYIKSRSALETFQSGCVNIRDHLNYTDPNNNTPGKIIENALTQALPATDGIKSAVGSRLTQAIKRNIIR